MVIISSDSEGIFFDSLTYSPEPVLPVHDDHGVSLIKSKHSDTRPQSGWSCRLPF